MGTLEQLTDRVRKLGGTKINLQIWPEIDVIEMSMLPAAGPAVKVSGLSIETVAATMLQRMERLQHDVLTGRE